MPNMEIQNMKLITIQWSFDLKLHSFVRSKCFERVIPLPYSFLTSIKTNIVLNNIHHVDQYKNNTIFRLIPHQKKR